MACAWCWSASAWSSDYTPSRMCGSHLTGKIVSRITLDPLVERGRVWRRCWCFSKLYVSLHGYFKLSHTNGLCLACANKRSGLRHILQLCINNMYMTSDRLQRPNWQVCSHIQIQLSEGEVIHGTSMLLKSNLRNMLVLRSCFHVSRITHILLRFTTPWFSSTCPR